MKPPEMIASSSMSTNPSQSGRHRDGLHLLADFSAEFLARGTSDSEREKMFLKAADHLDCQIVAISFFDGDNLNLTFCKGPANFETELQSIQPSQRICDQCFQQDQTFLHLPNDAFRANNLTSHLVEMGARCYLGAPVDIDGVRIGCVSFFSTTKSEFTDVQISFVRTIATLTAAFKERDNLEHRLLESQKMQTSGQLAHGIGHEFNNLLSVINTYIQLMQRLPLTTQQTEYMGSINKAVERATSLAKRMLTLDSGSTTEETVWVNSNEVVQELLPTISAAIGTRIVVNTSLEQNIRPIRVDRSEFEFVLINLILNSRDSMVNGGNLDISTRTISHASQGSTTNYLFELCVADDGAKMIEEEKLRCFEPFFAKKEGDQRRTLSLTMVNWVVTAWGGEISVQSSQQHGTKFIVRLPND